MFTGLIQDIGIVRAAEKHDGGMRLEIETGLSLKNVSVGASIACSGVCLTVTEIDGNVFHAELSGETLSKTTLGNWCAGTRVNLEPSLRMGDELGGHFVFGHVDGLAELARIEQDGESHRLKIKVPEALASFIAPKGSVSLDGVSLTVNEVDGDVFGVNIIPHTWNNTTLGQRQAGDFLNIEVDMLARYVARMMNGEKAA